MGFCGFFILANKNYFHPLSFFLRRFQAWGIRQSRVQFSFLAVWSETASELFHFKWQEKELYALSQIVFPWGKGIITGVCNEDLTAGSLQDANCEEHSVQEPRWELVWGTFWSWKRLFENYRSKHELQRHLKDRFSVASDIWTLKTLSDASYSLPQNPKIKFRGQFWVNCYYCVVIRGVGL